MKKLSKVHHYFNLGAKLSDTCQVSTQLNLEGGSHSETCNHDVNHSPRIVKPKRVTHPGQGGVDADAQVVVKLGVLSRRSGGLRLVVGSRQGDGVVGRDLALLQQAHRLAPLPLLQPIQSCKPDFEGRRLWWKL